MRRMPWAVYLWPGLPYVWARGSWTALLVAGAAAGALNLALAGTLVWTQLLGQNGRGALWLALGISWLASAVVAAAGKRRLMGAEERAGGTFDEALQHYLRGNWFECERALARLLRQNARDLEARLMLATLLRHTRRFEEAAEEMDVLTRFEGAEKWQWEIHRERELLSQARTEAAAETTAGLPAAVPPSEMTHAA